jgi:DMSO/TMAO reductase YedYZ molybdopterin-dependent catalytic subunit
MSFVSRGFRGRRREDADPARVPPGQHVTRDFPVLSIGPTPRTALDEWTFEIVGGAEPARWTWEEFRALPSETITAEIHCVTKSAKWVRGLRLLDEDEPGFWEQNGYHLFGDPWREQRYWGD